MNLWAVEMLWDNGTWRHLWSGWDRRYEGPNGEPLPILFRTREVGRAWVRENGHPRWRTRLVRVRLECLHLEERPH